MVQEAKAKETIQQLRYEVGNLTRVLESGGGINAADQATLDDLLAQKEALAAERDVQVSILSVGCIVVADFERSICGCTPEHPSILQMQRGATVQTHAVGVPCPVLISVLATLTA